MAFQMHPVLRQMKSAQNVETNTECLHEGEGIARLQHEPARHPRAQLKRDASEAYVPKQNVLRDEEPQLEQMRDLKFHTGQMLELPKKTLSSNDFEIDETVGISPAKAHIQAANLATAYQQTIKQEASFQKTFNNTVRTFLCQDEVVIGLLHLWDFIEAYLSNPASKVLASQLLLILQHCQDNGFFRESLLSITEPEARWLRDLINVLQSIIVQEQTLKLDEKLAAINYSVITLAKHYARKIFQSPFVPIDKEVKIETFYMRTILKILALCNDLGVYRNEKLERVMSVSRKQEMADAQLMSDLRYTLSTFQDSEDDE